MRFLFFLVMLISFACVRKPDEAKTKVIYGNEVLRNDPLAKSVVRVMIGFDKPNGEPSTGSCSGAIISEKVVITAAHCFNVVPTYTGIETYEGKQIRASTARLHKHYRISTSGVRLNNPFSPQYDIAVVLFDKPLPGIVLPMLKARDVLERNQEFTISGYGDDENDNRGLLRSGTNHISYVNKMGASFSSIWEFQRVANGDSGGPALIKRDGTYIIAGLNLAITAFGESQFTDIRAYESWIPCAIASEECELARSR